MKDPFIPAMLTNPELAYKIYTCGLTYKLGGSEMPQSISVTDDIGARLRKYARFGGCDESEVIRRLLNQLESEETEITPSKSVVDAHPDVAGSRYLPGRAPRERGAKIRLDSSTFYVDSVRTLLETVLQYLVKNGKTSSVTAVLPYKTSNQRYLIAKKPVHPHGNPFFVPVEYGGFYMEAHKSYKTATTDLQEFLGRLNVAFEYISA